MTFLARLRGRVVQVLRPSKGGTGPKRWQRLILIPGRAKRRTLVPVVGKSQIGVEYKWKSGGATFRVRFHDPDPSIVPTPAVPHPNALKGWIVRVSRGKNYLDTSGRFHPRSKFKKGGPDFDEGIVNETHIPIVPPVAFP